MMMGMGGFVIARGHVYEYDYIYARSSSRYSNDWGMNLLIYYFDESVQMMNMMKLIRDKLYYRVPELH